jgi:FixJ family two-component response regulator
LPGKIYVVDDDLSFRTALKRRLQQDGYQVETFSSAEELLERRPDEGEPGCILIDVRLPGLSGPELQSRLNTLGSTLPIVFITGHPDIGTTVQTLKAGAEDFLTKPVKSDELIGAIERALARYENTRGLITFISQVYRLANGRFSSSSYKARSTSKLRVNSEPASAPLRLTGNE